MGKDAAAVEVVVSDRRVHLVTLEEVVEAGSEAVEAREIIHRLVNEADMPHSPACAWHQDDPVAAHDEGRPMASCNCAVKAAFEFLSR